MKIILNGACGFMCKEVAKLASANFQNAEIVGGIDPFMQGNEDFPCVKNYEDAKFVADCIIDFSHHSTTISLLDYAVKNNLPLVLCTTGHTEDEKAKIIEASSKIPLFYSANMSVGVSLLIELAKKVALTMDNADIEIIEKHHNRKVDAPSGTALMIYNEIKQVKKDAYKVVGRNGMCKRQSSNEIGIHSLRMGNVVGEHEVIVCTPNQTITLKHEAHNRALFAEGALTASSFIIGKPNGLYDMKDMLNN